MPQQHSNASNEQTMFMINWQFDNEIYQTKNETKNGTCTTPHSRYGHSDTHTHTWLNLYILFLDTHSKAFIILIHLPRKYDICLLNALALKADCVCTLAIFSQSSNHFFDRISFRVALFFSFHFSLLLPFRVVPFRSVQFFSSTTDCLCVALISLAVIIFSCCILVRSFFSKTNLKIKPIFFFQKTKRKWMFVVCMSLWLFKMLFTSLAWFMKWWPSVMSNLVASTAKKQRKKISTTKRKEATANEKQTNRNEKKFV